MVNNAKYNGEWIKIKRGYVEGILKKVWKITGERDLSSAITLAGIYGGKELKDEIGFLKKLIQLEASGYVDPPMQFTELYLKVRASG